MKSVLRGMFDHLGYTMSLPERVVRSMVAVAGGATKIISDSVLPESLRGTRTYGALIGNAQRFIIEKVAEVEGVYEADAGALPDDYVPRKVAGNVMEAAGMFSIHLSPLWVFAIASDVAGGSRKYLSRLTEELRQDGVIDESTNVSSIDELLGAIGAVSDDSADVFDAPPITRADVEKLRNQLVGGYGNVFSRVTDLMPRIDTMWDQMQTLADPQKGMASLAGLMSMDVGKMGGQAVNGILAVGRVTTDMVGENMLDSYAKSLERVQRDGLAACIDEATQPYVNAFYKQYNRAQKSWTERAMGWMADKCGLGGPKLLPEPQSPPALPHHEQPALPAPEAEDK
jgi:hypothetical protein